MLQDEKRYYFNIILMFCFLVVGMLQARMLVAAPANVMFLLDDSGSMDWEVLTVPYYYFEDYVDISVMDAKSIKDGSWYSYSRDGYCEGLKTNYLYMFDNYDNLYGRSCRFATSALTPEAIIQRIIMI